MSVVNNDRYTNSEAVLARKNQVDPWIMYLIVRESLNMGSGKIAAQVGHAVGMIYGKFIQLQSYWDDSSSEYTSNLWTSSGLSLEQIKSYIDCFNSWSNNSFRKIVLRADDREWEKLKRQLECYLVVDAGFTEVASGSETVIALWPMLKSSAPTLIKRLRLL